MSEPNITPFEQELNDMHEWKEQIDTQVEKLKDNIRKGHYKSITGADAFYIKQMIENMSLSQKAAFINLIRDSFDNGFYTKK